jgi:hypothetical protein
MPLDGTDLQLFGNHPLAKLGAVESLLATEQQWCKGQLRDNYGRHCLIGAMQAAEAPQTLEPIILRAARQIGGKYYWRIEYFNDDPRTSHTDVLRVLRLARENIITEMIHGDQRRPWRERLAQALRGFSGSLGEACNASWFEQRRPAPLAAAPSFLSDQSAALARERDENASAREVCNVP